MFVAFDCYLVRFHLLILCFHVYFVAAARWKSIHLTQSLRSATAATATASAASKPSPPPPKVENNKIEVFVDDKPVLCDPGMTVLQACSLVGVEVPRQVFPALLPFIY